MKSETYLIKYDGELYAYPTKVNPRGFTFDEAKKYIEKMQWENAILISINKEIKKYNLKGDITHKILLDPEMYDYDTWVSSYNDNNINGIKLPICIDANDEYVKELEKIYKKYLIEINKPAFVYEDGLVSEIENTCQSIISIVKLLISGDVFAAERQLKDMIKEFSVHPFFVNELDKSYSFREIAPYIDLQMNEHENVCREMRDIELSFFRVRTKKDKEKDDISKLTHIVHLPYEKKENASNMRFSRVGCPCLYLGTTTYVCYKECAENLSNEEMYAASFIPNEQGKKLRILNLTISQALINGIYHRRIDNSKNKEREKLQIMMLKIFPLVIATSFRVREKNREIKYEYLISQALMKVVNEIGIDGIAYLSMKGKNEFQYPQGVNLALPAWDITEEKQYSSICDAFNISLPIKFCQQDSGEKKSYINSIYKKQGSSDTYDYLSKVDIDGKGIYYGDTKYGKFDNYLVSQPLYKFEKRF